MSFLSRQIALLGFSIVLTGALQASDPPAYRTAQKVLYQLCDASGFYGKPKPLLKMTRERGKVAAYYPTSNTIQLDEKAYRLCTQFGRDSLAALAFILGHELAHARPEPGKDKGSHTSFLAFDRDKNTSTQNEKNADLNGMFSAYLAGYDIRQVAPGILQEIYEAYGLMDKTLPGYPGLKERQGYALEILDKVDHFIDLYESANYLIALQQYELARKSLEFIAQDYQGQELHNNIGVLYTLQAMDRFPDPMTDGFSYPIELDWNTRLVKKSKSRGGDRISPHDLTLRLQLLNAAEEKFKKALVLAPGYTVARTNLACVLIMKGMTGAATNVIMRSVSGKDTPKIKNYNGRTAELQVLALCKLFSGDTTGAQSAWRSLSRNPDPLVRNQAEYNQAIISKNKQIIYPGRLEIPEATRSMLLSISPGRSEVCTPVAALDRDGLIVAKRESGGDLIMRFGTGDNIQLQIRRIKMKASNTNLTINPLSPSGFDNVIAANPGWMICDYFDKYVVRTDKSGKVLELVRLFEW